MQIPHWYRVLAAVFFSKAHYDYHKFADTIFNKTSNSLIDIFILRALEFSLKKENLNGNS